MMIVRILRLALASVVLSFCWAGKSENQFMVSGTTPSLLRFNRAGSLVSSNWADYARWDCTGEGQHRTCALDTSSTADFQSGSGTEGIPSYVDGVLMYAAIAWAAALLLILGTLIYALYALCLKVYKCCVAQGCVPAHAKALISPQRRHIASTALLSVFCLLLFVLLMLAVTLGLNELFAGTSEVPDGPRGAAQLFYRMALAMQPTFISVMSTVVLPTLQVTNQTLTEAISFPALEADLRVLNMTFHLLPDVAKMRSQLRQVSYNTGNLSSLIGDTLLDASALQAARADLLTAAYVLLADLVYTNSSLANLSSTISDGQRAVAQLDVLYVDFFGRGGPENYSFSDTNGSIDLIQHDMTVTRRNSTPGQGLPLSSTFQQASTGPSASTLRLLSGAYDSANLAELQTLNSRLRSIYYAITLLPNFTLTAQTLVSVNTSLLSMLETGGILDEFDAFFEQFDADYAALPQTALLTAHVNAVFDEIGRLDTAQARAHVDAMDPYVSDLFPLLQALLSQVLRVDDAMRLLVAPLYDLMVVQVRSFNETIYKLPIDTADEFRQLNETIQDALVQSAKASGQIEAALHSLSQDVNITRYTDIIGTAQVGGVLNPT